MSEEKIVAIYGYRDIEHYCYTFHGISEQRDKFTSFAYGFNLGNELHYWVKCEYKKSRSFECRSFIRGIRPFYKYHTWFKTPKIIPAITYGELLKLHSKIENRKFRNYQKKVGRDVRIEDYWKHNNDIHEKENGELYLWADGLRNIFSS